MTPWLAAMFVGFLVIGLRGDRRSTPRGRLVLLVIIVVLGYEAVQIHAL